MKENTQIKKKKLPKEIIRPMGKNSTNLVTLPLRSIANICI
jgi:hypothetical protein